MKRILLIDDDGPLAEALQLMLESEGYFVVVLKDGTGIENFNGIMPDVILLDYRLPGQSGVEVAKNLKSLTKTKNIPIIMISAETTARQHALKAGANNFLAKPFDLNELVLMVQNCVGN